MHANVHQAAPGAEGGPTSDRLARLSHAVEHASHLLPAQGPITVFIHHNTLHGFEDLPFHEGVKKGAQVFGCQPYLSEDRYRHELQRGRIRFDELRQVVEQDLGDRAREEIPPLGTRFDLRLAMLQYPLRIGPTSELLWYVAEADSLRKVRPEASFAVRARLIAETRRWVVRDLRGGREPGRNGAPRPQRAALLALLDRLGGSRIESWTDSDWETFTLQSLWRLCCDGVRGLPQFTHPAAPSTRPRDLLLEATGRDADAPVNALLIPFCAAYLDQGIAHWPLPGRDEGFFRAFCAVYAAPGGPPDPWRRDLPAMLSDLERRGVTPMESIAESLDALGVTEANWDRFLASTLLALRGWAGMIAQIESRGDRVVHPILGGSLVEFLAVRLILDRLSMNYVAREALGIEAPVREFWGLLRDRIDPHWPPSVEQRAFLVFQLVQLFGVTPAALADLPPSGWSDLMREIEEFSALERRRVFHEAYERRFYAQSLDALALHAQGPPPSPASPRFQAMFCIDDREESIRRHLEEVAPDCATYGTAGFFSVAMYYRGAADAHFVPLCPAVIVPTHWVVEQVDGGARGPGRRSWQVRALGLASHRFHNWTRAIGLGTLLTAAVGVLASIPLVARTLFPRQTARTRRRLQRIVSAESETRLQLERTEPEPGPEGGHVGFSLEEMADIGEKVLREIGLVSGFARIVLTIGHGSTSMNNPHGSAYDCGACGGAPGGPNGRALAQILNDHRVREVLAARGLAIPDATVFVGGMHNTTKDSVTFYDVDLIPASHREEFDAVRADVDRACDRDAHERCRRFYSAPLTASLGAARQHVEARSEDLAQVRAELGHATNALCIVGRREWSRGLFLDRRAFLTSYDPTRDDAQGATLARVLAAVIPVCAGISLEYYFSYVDNNGYGSGTKLPHNITSLVGVMDGAASDLRTGLPWQMVEVHEPVRILFVIETTPEVMLGIMAGSPAIARLYRNEWARLALIDPTTRRLSLFRGGAFEPYAPQSQELPRASSSADWYRGYRDHLEFAVIAGANAPSGAAS